jgi:hypothetical protein
MARNVAAVELALSVLNPPHLMLGCSPDFELRQLRARPEDGLLPRASPLTSNTPKRAQWAHVKVNEAG